MARPKKPILLFCDQDYLAPELRLVLETRLPVKVHVEPDLTAAVEYCTALAETEERFQLIMVASGNAHAASRLRDLGRQCGANFLSVLSSEKKVDLLARVHLLLQAKRGPKPASKERAA